METLEGSGIDLNIFNWRVWVDFRFQEIGGRGGKRDSSVIFFLLNIKRESSF